MIKQYIRNKIITWINKSFQEYININWKNFSNRDKDVALSVKASFIQDVVHKFI